MSLRQIIQTAVDDPIFLQKITSALNEYRSDIFPYGVLDVLVSGDLSARADGYELSLTLPFPARLEAKTLSLFMQKKFESDILVKVNCSVEQVRAHNVAGVGNVIAIASGKGGVGKSTTTVNLAHALVAEGASVAILDADIYGPSIPTMLGLKHARPESPDGKHLGVLENHGIATMSIGYLVAEDDATVWRGPMASSAFGQLLNETLWPEVDYLLIDMPPGTGDIQLTLSQKVPVAAACIVTTPQDIALLDATKGVSMFNKVQVPVLGVIENMSYHQCSQCGHIEHLFGADGGEKIARKQEVQLLGQLPLQLSIRVENDAGMSPLLTDSTGEVAMSYRKIAQKMVSQLYYQLDNRSAYTAEICIQEEK